MRTLRPPPLAGQKEHFVLADGVPWCLKVRFILADGVPCEAR